MNVLDWQKIDTAPKNDIIVLTEGGDLYQGFWQDGMGWITGHNDGRMHVHVILEPTHWAPLPSGPNDTTTTTPTKGNQNE